MVTNPTSMIYTISSHGTIADSINVISCSAINYPSATRTAYLFTNLDTDPSFTGARITTTNFISTRYITKISFITVPGLDTAADLSDYTS